MRARGRRVRVSAKELAQLEARFGAQSARVEVPLSQQEYESEEVASAAPRRRLRSDATLREDRRLHPQDHEIESPKFAAHHHLEDPVLCLRCGASVKWLVQVHGKGPCAIGQPVCRACGEIEHRAIRRARALEDARRGEIDVR